MYDIDNALSWEFRELITRESETILPLFLLYSFSSSSLVFGIKIYKTFYQSLRAAKTSKFAVETLAMLATSQFQMWYLTENELFLH